MLLTYPTIAVTISIITYIATNRSFSVTDARITLLRCSVQPVLTGRAGISLTIKTRIRRIAHTNETCKEEGEEGKMVKSNTLYHNVCVSLSLLVSLSLSLSLPLLPFPSISSFSHLSHSITIMLSVIKSTRPLRKAAIRLRARLDTSPIVIMKIFIRTVTPATGRPPSLHTQAIRRTTDVQWRGWTA